MAPDVLVEVGNLACFLMAVRSARLRLICLFFVGLQAGVRSGALAPISGQTLPARLLLGLAGGSVGGAATSLRLPQLLTLGLFNQRIEILEDIALHLLRGIARLP